ncbi:HigA family addiction module antitoxin [Novosphingobium huizhouense]|uniref:HigA family addiction module antitoxin n=1 Tax=Novosphingobium huizhouense TaxID=2866625 RepID=UPI001CD9080F|nr:HigA family addiction module antitoxin [Novosphingobium huizhouense]
MAIRLHSSLAVHPGGWLRRQVLDPHGLTVKRAAEVLHVSRPALSNLLNGNAGLSAEMAIRFEKVFGLEADTLLRMQSAWDIAQARQREDEIAVEHLPELMRA